ncbi:Berberine bridge enzyme-like 26 [Bienertia sinuspersici]
MSPTPLKKFISYGPTEAQKRDVMSIGFGSFLDFDIDEMPSDLCRKDRSNVTISDVVNKMKEQEGGGEDFKRNFVIMVVLTLIKGNQKGMPNYKLLKCLGVVNSISSLNWSQFALESLAVVLEMKPEDEIAWVQCGETLGEVFYNIARKSRVHGFPGGMCPTVGVGGHVSGAGYGNMMRKYVLTSNNVIDAEIVDADGRVLNRKTMGEDLFSVIRGGGGSSFGVICIYDQADIASTIDDNLFIRLTMDDINQGSPRKDTSELKPLNPYVKDPIPKEGLEIIWKKMIELETPRLTFNPYGGKMS